jgi:hypothetical protein
VTSLTICARSRASSTTYTCPSILRWENSDVIWGTYRKRFALRWEGNGTGTDLKRSDEHVVCVQIRNDLKPACQRNDLSLDMLVQNPTFRSVIESQGLIILHPRSHPPNEPNANLLIKHLQHFLIRTALQQLTVHLETLDRFGAPMRCAKIERGVFWRVIRTWRG